jgi:hypothetical protein
LQPFSSSAFPLQHPHHQSEQRVQLEQVWLEPELQSPVWVLDGLFPVQVRELQDSPFKTSFGWLQFLFTITCDGLQPWIEK